MRAVICKNLKEIKDDYEELFRQSKTNGVYQSFEFLKLKLKTLEFNRLYRFIRYKRKIRFIKVFDDDEKLCLILPVEMNKKIQTITTLDCYDLICGDCDDEKVFKCLNFIAESFNQDLEFFNVTPSTRLFALSRKYNSFKITAEHSGASIDFSKFDSGDKYNSYFRSLSKSARQNIRTAYNRMKADKIVIDFGVSENRKDKKLLSRSKKLYAKRYAEKNGRKKFSLKKLFIKFYNPIETICYNSEKSFHAYLKINKKLVAYLAGFCQNDSVIVPRLAYDSTYSRYSPGILLINELAKWISENGNINVLDLGYGNEPYKYVMGGEPYMIYDLKMEKINVENTKH